MGTTLANLHVLGGDETQLRALLPEAAVGCWSDRFVSAYSKEFIRFSGKDGRSLSRKMTQPILLAWISDSDAVGFSLYQGGKTIAEHMVNLDRRIEKMGNTALFCQTLGLPAEDASRLRTLWRKGDAEEQMTMTAMLLGLPLYNDCIRLPDKLASRDSETVDQWIAERPALPKVKSETKAVLLQEIPRFRMCHLILSGALYGSIEPYGDEYSYDRVHLWIPNETGTLSPGGSMEGPVDHVAFIRFHDRIIGFDHTSAIVFDSAGLLPMGYPTGGSPVFTSDSGLLWLDSVGARLDRDVTFTYWAPDGAVLWRSSHRVGTRQFFAQASAEIIFTSVIEGAPWLECVDKLTGETVKRIARPFGSGAHEAAYHNGFHWVTDTWVNQNDEKKPYMEHALIKYDNGYRPIVELRLPTHMQGLFFAPDHVYGYLFFFKNQVMVINTETFSIENVLNDKSFLSPLGFDSAGRFWLQRDQGTAEAWDASLSRTLSRHRLKGELRGRHQDARGGMCLVTMDDKEKVLRVYQLGV